MIKKFINFLESTLFPIDIKCINCGEELIEKNKYGLCPKCELTLNTKYCLKCGNGISNEALYCNYCMNNRREFTEAASAVIYDEKSKKIIYGLKFANKKYFISFISKYVIDTFYKKINEWDKIDYITYVPITKKTFKTRGFNQSQLIAKSLSDEVNITLLNALKKIKNTKELAKLNYNQRKQAIKDAFQVVEEFKKGSNFLLIDDVFTTGSTSEECAKVLKKAGAFEVYVLVFAGGQNTPKLY